MIGFTRTAAAAVLVALAGAAGAQAQIPGMPLFTNPRWGTGVRIHADIGQATEASVADRVVQGGVSLALGPVGLGANVGVLKDDLAETQTCVQNPQLGCEDQRVTASALAQIRVAGGGRSNLSLSLFGGASTEITSVDALDCSSITDPVQQAACNQLQQTYGTGARELTIPLGVAVGLRIPLGLASLNLWGAPRYNLTRYINCDAASAALCDTSEGNFRWAVGADLPIFRVLSVRAAYESGKINDQTVSYWGVGASIGFGGMR
jgi:hypothetical protein